MADELLEYLRAGLPDRIVGTFEHRDLLAWGVRDGDDVDLLGLSINARVQRPDFSPADLDSPELLAMVKAARKVCKTAGLRLIMIFYPSTINSNSEFRTIDLSASSKKQTVPEAKFSRFLQDYFDTDLTEPGTAKAVNVSTADAFMVWAREKMPKEYVRIDIDGLLLDSSLDPALTFEIKRSKYYSVEKWTPWEEDKRNYYLQFTLEIIRSDLTW